MDWSRVAHPFGLCLVVHVGVGPELVRVGRELVTNCLACKARAAKKQKMKPELCPRCQESTP